MENAPPTPKPAPSAAVLKQGGKAHAGHSHDTSGFETHGLETHSHNTHKHANHARLAPTPKDPTPASSALLSAPPITSVLGWPAWLRVLAVLPVIVLLWLAVAWASTEVAPW